MHAPLRRWLQVAFLNLLLVSLMGVILRYKIAFSFRFFNQRYLLHGHSHFAFCGWITQALMVLMVQWLNRQKGEFVFKEYRFLLYSNLFASYGMLIAFPLEGYAFWSICFSTMSIFVSYFFAFKFWKDLNRLAVKNIIHSWFKAAFIFSIMSSLGAFVLAFMMANKILHETWYLGAIYFFLHFQYNGWFFFAGMGLLISLFGKIVGSLKPGKIVFWLFCLACGPAYFLSALWMDIPIALYWLVVLSAVAQLIGWIIFIKMLRENRIVIKAALPTNGKKLLLLAALALTIKLVLQVVSTYPALSQLAFGFRPIVIGYLHLVLLGVITIFILGYIVSSKIILPGKYFNTGLWIFIAGILLNEILLMLQGVTGLSYKIVPYMNESLFVTALILFFGLVILNTQIRNHLYQAEKSAYKITE